MEEILCILAISQAVHGEGSGHLGQSLISGRNILTINLTLIMTADVINIQSPCLFLGRGCLYFIV